MKDYTVVEYSKSQKCFHINTLNGMVKSNLRVFFSDKQCDYLPIGIFNNDKEAHEYIEKMKKVEGYNRNEIEDGYLNQYQTD